VAHKGVAVVAACLLWGACGKKGPPLPPLVRVPVAPGELKAERRGNVVDIALVVPSQNTDGSRPANMERIDLYALSSPSSPSPEEVLKRGTRVGSLSIKAPRDPDDTVSAGDPISDVAPLEGPGLDQGVRAQLRETLTRAAPREVDAATPDAATAEQPRRTRVYVAVGLTPKGRRGAISQPSAIALSPAPKPPTDPVVSYDAAGVRLAWTPPPVEAPAETPADQRLGASRLVYHVYELGSSDADVTPSPGTPDAASRTGGPTETRLTGEPLSSPPFVDKRLDWGKERCYAVRSVQSFEGLVVEGEATPPACVTPFDTFAPGRPTGLTAVASGGVISLIWNPSPEPDLAGYHVLRGGAGATELTRLTPSPITETTYSDPVQAGPRFVYAVQAVDTEGNVSERSETVEDAAR